MSLTKQKTKSSEDENQTQDENFISDHRNIVSLATSSMSSLALVKKHLDNNTEICQIPTKSKKNSLNKLHALRESFYSEKNYIADMSIWLDGFKKAILNMECLPNTTKNFLCNVIFINTQSIIDMHVKFYEGMKAKNYECMERHYKDKPEELDPELKNSEEFIVPMDGSVDPTNLEYFFVFSEHFSEGVQSYINYMKDLPACIYEFERLRHMNKAFDDEVNRWFEENNLIELGPDHFFYRPPTKIARYSVLDKNLLKYETEARVFQEGTKQEKDYKVFVNDMDSTFKQMNDYHKLYILRNRIKFINSKHNFFSLGMMSKDVVLVHEKRIITKLSIIQPASYKVIMLFNTSILITNTFEHYFEDILVDTPAIFLSRCMLTKEKLTFFDMVENLHKYYPIYLVQSETLDIKGLYFEDEYSRDEYYGILEKAIKKTRLTKKKTFEIVTAEKYRETIDTPLCMLCCKAEKLRAPQDIEIDIDKCKDVSSETDSGTIGQIDWKNFIQRYLHSNKPFTRPCKKKV